MQLFETADTAVFGQSNRPLPTTTTTTTDDDDRTHSAHLLERLSLSPSTNPPTHRHPYSIQALMCDSVTAFRHQCVQESEALLSSCPPHLSQVNQTYMRQVEACQLADQCNAGQPLFSPPPEIVLSSVQPHSLLSSSSSISGKKDATMVGNKKKKTKEEGVDEDEEARCPLQEGNVENASNLPVIHFSFDSKKQSALDAIVATEKERRRRELQLQQQQRQQQEKTKKRKEEGSEEEQLQQMRREYMQLVKQLKEPCAPPEAQLPAINQPALPPLAGSGGSAGVGGNSIDNHATEQQQQQQQKEGEEKEEGEEQDDAEAIMKSIRIRQEIIRVFCVENLNERNGAYYRNFVATSYASVWKSFVSAARPGILHWYEVIREGRPCHLYFDVEFGRGEGWNEGVDGDRIIDSIVAHTVVIFKQNWGIHMDPLQHVYELDSSKEDKFSRHIIVRMPGYAFLTNHAVGHVVTQVVQGAGEEVQVAKSPLPSTERCSAVDLAVYSRNRHFRIVYCSKGGKAAVLTPTSRYVTGARKLSPARVFQDTLICNVDVVEGVKLLAVLPPGLPLNFGSTTTTTTTTSMSLLPAVLGSSSNRKVHQGEVVQQGGRVVTWKQDDDCEEEEEQEAHGGSNPTAMPIPITKPKTNRKSKIKTIKSIAEKAVLFIEKIASQRAGQPARARTVAFCGNDGLVAYSMIGPGSHYCQHIGRDHKSNHVYYVANVVQGVFAQKCHDPDCARYRSEWMPLPPELCMKSSSSSGEEGDC